MVCARFVAVKMVPLSPENTNDILEHADRGCVESTKYVCYE